LRVLASQAQPDGSALLQSMGWLALQLGSALQPAGTAPPHE
jgi:hypothetical protein